MILKQFTVSHHNYISPHNLNFIYLHHQRNNDNNNNTNTTCIASSLTSSLQCGQNNRVPECANMTRPPAADVLLPRPVF